MDDREYTIHVAITNEDGLFGNSQTLTAYVVNLAPTIAVSGAPVAEEGLPYILTLGPVIDPGTDTATVWIDWGDESSIDSYVVPSAITHVYRHGPAQCQIQVNLRDEDGVYPAAERSGPRVRRRTANPAVRAGQMCRKESLWSSAWGPSRIPAVSRYLRFAATSSIGVTEPGRNSRRRPRRSTRTPMATCPATSSCIS